MIQSKEFIRDEGSNALINTNRKAFEERKRIKHQLQKNSEMESEINSLKNDIKEIKDILKCIADRKD